jgi:hypothetical protein
MCDSGGHRSAVPVSGQKCLEIRLGNPHQSVDLVRDEQPFIDPAPHAARRRFHAVGDLLDRVEFGGRLRPIGFHLLTPKYL